jgi:hypothetical protein
MIYSSKWAPPLVLPRTAVRGMGSTEDLGQIQMLTFDYAKLSAPSSTMSSFVTQLLVWERDNPGMQLTPEAMANLVRAAKAASEQDEHHEKRQYKRVPLVAHVAAMPLDDHNQPVGAPFMMMTRNISTVGISLIHSAPIKFKRLAIELQAASGGKIQLAVEILRCQKLGEFYEIGGKLLCKLGSSEVPIPRIAKLPADQKCIEASA